MASQFVTKAIKVIIDTGKLHVAVTPDNARHIRGLIEEARRDGTISVTTLKCNGNTYMSFRDMCVKKEGEAKIIPFPKRKAA